MFGQDIFIPIVPELRLFGGPLDDIIYSAHISRLVRSVVKVTVN